MFFDELAELGIKFLLTLAILIGFSWIIGAIDTCIHNDEVKNDRERSKRDNPGKDK